MLLGPSSRSLNKLSATCILRPVLPSGNFVDDLSRIDVLHFLKSPGGGACPRQLSRPQTEDNKPNQRGTNSLPPHSMAGAYFPSRIKDQIRTRNALRAVTRATQPRR